MGNSAYCRAVCNFETWFFSEFQIEWSDRRWAAELIENIADEFYNQYGDSDEFIRRLSEIIPEVTEDEVREHFVPAE